MSLETYLVDIQDVSSSQLRSNFSEKDLKNMAELILELGGLIQPLIIKEGGLRRFEVIEGHFEYYAVVKAQEIDDNLEMVRAFIINENAENSAKKQLQFLNAREPINPIVDPDKPPSPSIANNEWKAEMFRMESRQNNLEIRLGELIDHQKQDFKRLTDTLQAEIRSLKTAIPAKTDPLEVFNNLSLPELSFRLKMANITGKTAEKILKNIENARQEKPFQSFSDLVSRVQGLSQNKMIAIIDIWSKTSFL
jgi:Predicted RNA-binding protein